jgi:hypothetical protein
VIHGLLPFAFAAADVIHRGAPITVRRIIIDGVQYFASTAPHCYGGGGRETGSSPPGDDVVTLAARISEEIGKYFGRVL